MTAFGQNKKPVKPEAALIRLEDLCARSEQCVAEVRRKLYMWQIAAADADAIVRSLVQRRFIDDARYASAFVRDKYRFARWGRRKIEMALRQKQIDDNIIADALGSIDEEEYREVLKHLLEVKAKSIEEPETYENRLRLMRFAMARGFEASLVSAAINEINNK